MTIGSVNPTSLCSKIHNYATPTVLFVGGFSVAAITVTALRALGGEDIKDVGTAVRVTLETFYMMVIVLPVVYGCIRGGGFHGGGGGGGLTYADFRGGGGGGPTLGH